MPRHWRLHQRYEAHSGSLGAHLALALRIIMRQRHGAHFSQVVIVHSDLYCDAIGADYIDDADGQRSREKNRHGDAERCANVS
jgi:hypothetical protein